MDSSDGALMKIDLISTVIIKIFSALCVVCFSHQQRATLNADDDVFKSGEVHYLCAQTETTL